MLLLIPWLLQTQVIEPWIEDEQQQALVQNTFYEGQCNAALAYEKECCLNRSRLWCGQDSPCVKSFVSSDGTSYELCEWDWEAEQPINCGEESADGPTFSCRYDWNACTSSAVASPWCQDATCASDAVAEKIQTVVNKSPEEGGDSNCDQLRKSDFSTVEYFPMSTSRREWTKLDRGGLYDPENQFAWNGFQRLADSMFPLAPWRVWYSADDAVDATVLGSLAPTAFGSPRAHTAQSGLAARASLRSRAVPVGCELFWVF